MTTISVWFFGEGDMNYKKMFPMVMIYRNEKRRYHYNVTTASLKRIDKQIRNIKSEYKLLTHNGWSIDFKENKQ